MFSAANPFSAGQLGHFVRSCLSALLLLGVNSAVLAEQPATTLATLLDKAQIQDLIVDYYAQLGTGSSNFGTFYVADGFLDVNGRTAQGKEAIEALYRASAAATPPRPGTFRMVLTNMKVVVNGNTATADMLWTGVNSETLAAPPQVVEQGREHDDLVKQNGRWLFKHRVITADAGLPPWYEKTYKKR
jgi:SnoaL-like domain